jgi:hypothetical protein
MNEVCGEPVCGACYGEELLTEPYRPAKRTPPVEPWMFKGSIEKTLRKTGG